MVKKRLWFFAHLYCPNNGSRSLGEKEKRGRERGVNYVCIPMSVCCPNKAPNKRQSKIRRMKEVFNKGTFWLCFSLGRNMAVKHCITLFFVIKFSSANICGNNFGTVINGLESDFEVSSEHVT